MAQDAPTVHNTRLLLVAVALALVVVVIYNVRINQIKNEGKQVGAVKVMIIKDMAAGQSLKSDYLRKVEVSTDAARWLKDVVNGSDLNDDLLKKPLNQAVAAGKWLRYDYLPESGMSGPATKIPERMVGRGYPVDERTVPGDILRVGGRVNLLAELPNAKGGYTTYRVVEALTVNGIQGQTQTDTAGSGYSTSVVKSSYRQITVSVRPEVSTRLNDVLAYARRGVFLVEVVNPTGQLPPAAGQILPEVEKVMSTLTPSMLRSSASPE